VDRRLKGGGRGVQSWLGCDGKNKNSSLHHVSCHDCVPDIQAHNHSLQQGTAANCIMQTELICTVRRDGWGMQHVLRTECTDGLVQIPKTKQQLGRTSNEWEDIKLILKQQAVRAWTVIIQMESNAKLCICMS
jgi:hypothetical protein